MAAGNNNGRVTNARLEAKLDGIAAELDDFIAVQREHNRIADEERKQQAVLCSTPDTRLDNLDDDVDRLKNRSNVWDFLNSLGALGAFLSS